MLSIAENLFLGHEIRKPSGLIDWKETNRRSRELLEGMGIHGVDVTRPLNQFKTAIQQMVSIARAINIEAKLLILDEPTSSLDAAETEVLFREMRRLKEKGISMIYVSHKMEEIFEICDNATILKDGELVGTFSIQELDYVKLLSLMIGRDASGLYEEKQPYGHDKFANAPIVCAGKNITKTRLLHHVDIEIHEKAKWWGWPACSVPAARSWPGYWRERTRTIPGNCTLAAKRSSYPPPRHAIAHKVTYCPEDRKAEGIFSIMSVLDTSR